MNKLKDITILKALYFGNHLEPDELKRAKEILHGINLNFKSRV